jgi:hypothetical protein
MLARSVSPESLLASLDNVTLRRLFWLMIYIPLNALAELFEWLAGKAYQPLYRENSRIERLRRERQGKLSHE